MARKFSVYEDEEIGIIEFKEVNNLPVLSFDFFQGFTPSLIKRYEDILVASEMTLNSLGLKRYYVVAAKGRDSDFAEWMGFTIIWDTDQGYNVLYRDVS